jgi:mannose-1-phosphate guanylyltransferase
MEGAERVLNVAATFDWSDVGGWPAVAEAFGQDAEGNCFQGPVTARQVSQTTVYSNQSTRIGLLGVQDLIIVQTADALLIAHRSAADEIKKLVDLLPRELL